MIFMDFALASVMSSLLCFAAGMVVALVEMWWPRWNLADLASRLMLTGIMSFVVVGILFGLVAVVTR